VSAKPAFASEAALCADFSVAAAAQGWTIYPETSGWDLLLVKGGTQIGVQAKLRPNLKVLAQAAQPLQWGRCGPDFLSVLVPDCEGEFRAVAQAAGIMVLWKSRDRIYSDGWRSVRHYEDLVWPNLDEKCEHTPSHAFEAPCFRLKGDYRGQWVRRPGEVLPDAQHPAEFQFFIAEERERVATGRAISHADTLQAKLCKLTLFPDAEPG